MASRSPILGRPPYSCPVSLIIPGFLCLVEARAEFSAIRQPMREPPNEQPNFKKHTTLRNVGIVCRGYAKPLLSGPFFLGYHAQVVLKWSLPSGRYLR